MDAIYLGYGETFVEFCLKEIQKGGSEISKITLEFLKTVDSQYSVIPLIESLQNPNFKREISIELLKKIGDKGISNKLSTVEEPEKYKKILMNEPALTKIVERLSV